MKLRGWWIDGFGHFRDYEVTGIGDGLTVFHGPNEAGKSTLLAFLRSMLFGFPDRRSRDARYEPLRGGRHGGRLLLEVEGEPWTLEREAGARGGTGLRLVTPRGAGTEDDLRRALGSADMRLFRNVFAFSLTELQSFETLSDEGARSRIFSAGIVGAGRAARQVVAGLEDQADALFKPRGRTQLIPTLLRQLAERRQDTLEVRRAARAYPDLVREEETCLTEKQRLEAALTAARSEARHVDRLLGLWTIWCDLQEAEAQRAMLELVDTFPADPERRLAEAASRRQAARTRCAEAGAEVENAELRVDALRGEIRAELAAIAPEVAAHFGTRDLHLSNVARLETARVELGHATEAFIRALHSLGEGWDEGRLLAFDVSLPQRDRIRVWGDRLRKADDDVRLAERDHAALVGTLQQAERDLATAGARLATAPTPDAERLAMLDTTLRRLRVRLGDRREREHAVERMSTVVAEREQQLRLLQTDLDPEPEPTAAPEPEPGPETRASAHVIALPGSASAAAPVPDAASTTGTTSRAAEWIVPLALVFFGVIGAAVLAPLRPWLAGVVAVLAVAAGFGAAAWLRRARVAAEMAAATERRLAAERLAAAERAMAAERAAVIERVAASEQAVATERRLAAERLAAAERTMAARRRTHASRLEAAEQQVAEARDAIERARREVEAIDRLMVPDVAALGLHGRPTSADLDDADRLLIQQRQDVVRAEQLRRDVSDAEARRDGARERVAASARQTERARSALEASRREWSVWAQAGGLPEDMGPESALDFVPAVQQAREHQHRRDKLAADVETLEREVRAWEERARRLLASTGADEYGAGAGLVEALHVLHSQCAADGVARQRLAAAETDRRACGSRLEVAAAEQRDAEDAWITLLAEAAARDEAEYLRRMQSFTERQRLLREIESLRRQLSGRLGDGPEADRIRATLATGAVAEWEREREHHEAQAAMLEQQLEQAIRLHQDAQRRRETLEMSADIALCEAEEQALRTALHDAVDRWRTLALARAFIEVTWRDYVRTRQPAVVANASEMFAAVTAGAYTDLRQDESGEGLSVVTRRGEVLLAEHLSRGTAEQLYLCLRLGLAAEFGSHGAQLPLVMDDVCVNFDPERARAIAAVLADYAAGQQIIFFTCHPSSVDMLRAVTPELQVHELPRFGLPARAVEPARVLAVND